MTLTFLCTSLGLLGLHEQNNSTYNEKLFHYILATSGQNHAFVISQPIKIFTLFLTRPQSSLMRNLLDAGLQAFHKRRLRTSQTIFEDFYIVLLKKILSGMGDLDKNSRIFALVCETNAHGLWTKGLERVWKPRVELGRDAEKYDCQLSRQWIRSNFPFLQEWEIPIGWIWTLPSTKCSSHLIIDIRSSVNFTVKQAGICIFYQLKFRRV